ncbi:hypothetical protein PRVXH_001685 [Proteinivorax hydrogeniformans]|uniref:Uncharacterized protein n=1 Tax=Proteinivorax hydrogeniformans TaxID=1826727 RepID=A0AAU8HR13_9FIRM
MKIIFLKAPTKIFWKTVALFFLVINTGIYLGFFKGATIEAVANGNEINFIYRFAVYLQQFYVIGY